MGSAALQPVRGAQARALLSELERQSRSAIAASGEIDTKALAFILDAHLDSLHERAALLEYLAAFLSRCLTGSVPDYRDWHPPT